MGPKGGEASSRRISFGCVGGFFFLDASKICNNWSLIFRKSKGEGGNQLQNCS